MYPMVDQRGVPRVYFLHRFCQKCTIPALNQEGILCFQWQTFPLISPSRARARVRAKKEKAVLKKHTGGERLMQNPTTNRH